MKNLTKMEAIDNNNNENQDNNIHLTNKTLVTFLFLR